MGLANGGMTIGMDVVLMAIFYIGSWYIQKLYKNSLYDKTYNGSDVMAVYQTGAMGIMMLAFLAPNY